MKYPITILLLSAFFMQTFSRVFLVADYITNTKVYIENCINKKKVQLQCNGKCQLGKKVEKEEKESQNNPVKKIENKFEVLSSKSFFSSLLFIDLKNTKNINGFYLCNTIASPSFDFFQPPRV